MTSLTKNIVIIQGHPDSNGEHFGHALEDAYTAGAEQAGHKVQCIKIAELDFPLLRTAEDWQDGTPVEAIQQSQQAITWAEHLVIIYPLWLGTMPALLKAFFEQVFRPGFAIGASEPRKVPKPLLKGKSARIVITMGMPAFFYRWYFRAHSLKNLERNILRFCGVGPIKENLIGSIEVDNAKRKKWLKKLRDLGRKAC